MLIGLERRFIFVANLKSASTAIEAALRPVSQVAIVEPGDVKHMPLSLLLLRFKWLLDLFDLDNFLIFGVMRDPVDYVISLYNSHKDDKFRGNRDIYTKDIGFMGFFETWTRRKDWQVQEQHKRFLSNDGSIGANYIISYQNIVHGMQYVGLRLNTENLANLRRDNESQIYLTRDDLTEAQIKQIQGQFPGDYRFMAKYCDRLLSPEDRRAWACSARDEGSPLPRKRLPVSLHASSDELVGNSRLKDKSRLRSDRMVSSDEVTMAYRLILGREPENDAVVKLHCDFKDISTLGRKLLASKEFALRNKRERALDYVALTGDPPAPLAPPTAIKGGSRICRQADFSLDAFRYWAARMHLPQRLHRKFWEWFFIADALFQRDCLRVGSRGIGFGVGTEPLTSLFASFGCNVLATDQPVDKRTAEGWRNSGQHAAELEALRKPEICGDEQFTANVQFLPLDMNEIPSTLEKRLGQFDFLWSSCALEHLGSLEHGFSFIQNAMALLKPGGVAAHTTEYNMTSNIDTIETHGLSLYRRRDIDALATRLGSAGDQLEPVDWDVGRGYADDYVDSKPYGSLHLRLKLGNFNCTSLGLIIRKGVSLDGKP